MDSEKAGSNGVHWYSFHFIVLEKRISHFENIWYLENVLSPEGTLRKQSPMGSIWYSFHFIVFQKRFWTFQNPNFHATFLKSWKCFIPRWDAANAEPNAAHLIFFPFYRVWETVLTPFKIPNFSRPFWSLIFQRDCEGRTEVGPIVFTYVLSKKCVLESVFDTFNLLTETRLFEILEIFYCPKKAWQRAWQRTWQRMGIKSVLQCSSYFLDL